MAADTTPGSTPTGSLPTGSTSSPGWPIPVDTSDYGGDQERMSSGVPALDGMLVDGYWRGAATVIAGPSGIGKTLLALHFVVAGAERGEKGVIATFQENPVQLERIMAGFSWTRSDPNIELMYRSPVDLYLDEWVHDFFDTLDTDRRQAGRDRQPRETSGPPAATNCASASTSTHCCNAAPGPTSAS